ncbi:hypothetical protein HORIV_50620 [Vreelandella olivaria]|uniref:Uncharacterized protein n=1 Tax=Vreelandella olivaria TaxID=390919 RepID=A0ABN5X0D4_9GAMM|nr:hypothetical protein HORIV_50620 [Halomonas olivaria]
MEVVVRQDTWDQVPDDLKLLIESAAKLTTYEGLSNFYHNDLIAMEDYRAGRNEVISLDEAFVEELSENGRAWIAARAAAESDAGNPAMEEILENYQAYQARWNAQKDYLITD